MSEPKVDVLYLTWNRRAFTEFSLQMLIGNTNWALVNRFILHDDGSDKQEGTVAAVERILGEWELPKHVEVIFHKREWGERFGSPPAVMNFYVDLYGDSERFCKVDSDIVVPPAYLEALLSVVEKNPHIEALGMEAGRMGPPGHNGAPWDWDRPMEGYGFERGSHIGGVGLIKTESLRIRPKLPEGEGRFGWTTFQTDYKIVRGWITPDLLVSELSRIPFDPWRSLHEEYVAKDWERDWPPMHDRWGCYFWSHWPEWAKEQATWKGEP